MRSRARSLTAALVLLLAPTLVLTGTQATVAPSVARATVVQALDLRGLVRGADHVVVGTVVSVEARYDHLDRIVTDATVRVDESMHGPARAGTTVVVRRLGGAIGDVGLHVEGEPSFVAGERIVLFARASASERVLRAVGMSQGVMPIRRDGGVEQVMPGGAGLALMQRDADGQLRPAPAALLAPAPIDELLAQVRELVSEIHGAR